MVYFAGMKRVFQMLCAGLLSVFCVVGPVAGQTPKMVYSLKAFLPGWSGGRALLKVEGRTIKSDTLQNDLFSVNDSVAGICSAVLEVYRKGKSLRCSFFLEPGTIRVRQEGPIDLVAFGTPVNDSMNRLVKTFDSLTRARQLSVKEAAAFQARQAIQFIQDHPASPISLQLLSEYRFLDRSNDSLVQALFHRLDPALQQAYAGKMLRQAHARRWNTAVGQPAPVVPLTDTAGGAVPLYVPGKILLIDFWASWCAPCRRGHPALIRVYNKYAGAGFAAVSVSLDGSRAQWLQAIRMDSLPWQQLADHRAFNSEVARVYSVNQIPTNFLLAADGTILARNLTPAELDRRLALFFAAGKE
jgi:thiol-disulfide isomerase/thioredoxin